MAIDQAPNETVPFFAANKDTRFELFTSKNPTKPQLLLLDNSTTIENSNFNSQLDTRFFIHGWLENIQKIYLKKILKEEKNHHFSGIRMRRC